MSEIERLLEVIEFNYRQPSGFNPDEKIRMTAIVSQLFKEYSDSENKKLRATIELFIAKNIENEEKIAWMDDLRQCLKELDGEES